MDSTFQNRSCASSIFADDISSDLAAIQRELLLLSDEQRSLH